MRFELHEAEGSSLVETVVSLSLFITTVVPLSLVLMYWGTRQRPEFDMKALQLARNTMEITLTHQDYNSEEYFTPDKAWRIRKEIHEEGQLIRIRIEVRLVARDVSEDDQVVLETLRLRNNLNP